MNFKYLADCSSLTRGIVEDLRKLGKQLTDLEIGQTCKSSRWFLLILDQVDRIKDQEGHDIVNWLSPLNFWLKQNDTFERRQEGTGEWLLEHPEFRKWIEGENRALWCPGDRTKFCQVVLIFTSRCWKDNTCVTTMKQSNN